MHDDDFDRACQFLNGLAAAMQRYGVSSHAMESSLGRVARALNLQSEFLATPTQVQSILWSGDENRQRLHVSVSRAGNYDMTKLAMIEDLVSQVESGALSPDDGVERLRAIDRISTGYGPSVDALAFALCGMGFGVILALSWRDVLLGAALSLVSFGLYRSAANSQGLSNALELVVAGIIAALATLLSVVFPGSNALGVAVCGLVYFVPGFGLTLGANELMVGNTLSGLIGFTNAAIATLKLLVGALIGTALVRTQVVSPLPDVGTGAPHVWTWLFAPLLVIGLALLFRVRARDIKWSVLGGLVVWTGIELGSELGFWQGTVFGAFALTATSRFFARKSHLPSAIILLPAVMLLVPGVATLQAFYTAETEGLVEGLRSAYRVVVLIAAVLGGVLLGDSVFSLRRPRFPPILSGISRLLRQDAED